MKNEIKDETKNKHKTKTKNINAKLKFLSECFEIFCIFFKTGFVAFGGGLAILKIYEDEFVVKRKWLTKDELFDYYTLSQITPGIIIINTSAFIGYKLKKQVGIFCSVIGVIIPSIITITIIAMFLNNILEYDITQKILKGMNVGISAVLLSLSIDLIKNSVKNKVYFLLCAFGFISMMFFDFSILIIVSIGALVGILYNKFKCSKNNDETKKIVKGGKND